MGVSKLWCSFGEHFVREDGFYLNPKAKSGRESRCIECCVVNNMLCNANKRVKCGNGVKECKKGCTQCATYAGLEFNLFGSVRKKFFRWAAPQVKAIRARGLKTSLDRIAGRVGYIYNDGDIINDERFGNMQIIPLADNIRRAAKDRRS